MAHFALPLGIGIEKGEEAELTLLSACVHRTFYLEHVPARKIGVVTVACLL
jgi:hypothetical protein